MINVSSFEPFTSSFILKSGLAFGVIQSGHFILQYLMPFFNIQLDVSFCFFTH